MTNQTFISKGENKAKKERVSFIGFAAGGAQGNNALNRGDFLEEEPLRQKNKSKSPFTKQKHN